MRILLRVWGAFLAALLCAPAAQAQNAWLEFDYDVRDLGSREVGTSYETRFTVHAINGATTVWISGQGSYATPATSVTFTDLQPLQGVVVTVVGQVPPAAGSFEDVIRFDYTTSTGTASDSVRIVGVARVPPVPHDYSVGVVPATASCPPGSPLVTFHMDDADHNNANRRGGWYGAFTSNINTTLRFCRVDGTRFRPFAVFNTTVTDDYAVLRMGTSCPVGATEFVRTFDNENSDNRNSVTSSSGNAAHWAPNESSRSQSRTKLYFCLFKNAYETMIAFPNLGFQYGVFAASDFTKAVSTGYVYTDDQDGLNENQFTGDTAGRRIVTPTSDGKNTTINLARVTRETRPVASCSASPSYGNYHVTAMMSSAGSYAREGRTLVSYQWRFAGTPASGAGPHQRSFTNINIPYQVFDNTLTVTDSAGETATASCPVTVYGPGGQGS